MRPTADEATAEAEAEAKAEALPFSSATSLLALIRPYLFALLAIFEVDPSTHLGQRRRLMLVLELTIMVEDLQFEKKWSQTLVCNFFDDCSPRVTIGRLSVASAVDILQKHVPRDR